MPKVELTNEFVRRCSDEGWYWDTVLAGFCLRVRRRKKVFAVCRRVNGTERNTTVSIATADLISVEEARERARQVIEQMLAGTNPNAVKKAEEEKKSQERERKQRAEEARQVTLQKVIDDYIRTRDLKPATQYSYRILSKRYLAVWLDKPIASITKKMVEERFYELSNHKAQANNIMRIVRALMTYASYSYEDEEGRSIIPENPVRRLSQLRAWHKIRRRQTLIKGYQLKHWYRAVQSSENEVVRDYLLFVLLTGLRKGEAAQLRWSDVDLQDPSFLVRDTKNGEPHELPLSDYLYDLLLVRYDSRINEFVFPGNGSTGYLFDCRWEYQKVIQACGVQFTLHDLRRTFLTVAESLDLSYYALKRLVNHKMSTDVTAGYIVGDVNRLREPMQRITNQFLSLFSEPIQPAEKKFASPEF